MTILLGLEIIIIIIFLVMFFRQTNIIWAVGLLTATSAVLLDVVLSIFGSDTTLASLGLWAQILGGLAFGGAAFWLWGILQPYLNNGSSPSAFSSPAETNEYASIQSADDPNSEQLLSRRAVGMRNDSSEYDRHLLFDQIRKNLGPEDVLDLIFDLEMIENELISPTKNMNQTIINVMDMAHERDQMGDLALAVERILTPVPPDHFPRLSRITVESPPTILRRYLLMFYNLEMLEEMSNALEIDWERLGLGSKQQKVRNLLLWIRRRNRMPELIEAMHARPVVSGNVNLR
ncbi:MAG: hypothetical protein ACI9EW_002396 [Cellvibrionaceae bacterium]|jgi:hypothetical protein